MIQLPKQNMNKTQPEIASLLPRTALSVGEKLQRLNRPVGSLQKGSTACLSSHSGLVILLWVVTCFLNIKWRYHGHKGFCVSTSKIDFQYSLVKPGTNLNKSTELRERMRHGTKPSTGARLGQDISFGMFWKRKKTWATYGSIVPFVHGGACQSNI